jgi:hypothetical protein
MLETSIVTASSKNVVVAVLSTEVPLLLSSTSPTTNNKINIEQGKNKNNNKNEKKLLIDSDFDDDSLDSLEMLDISPNENSKDYTRPSATHESRKNENPKGVHAKIVLSENNNNNNNNNKNPRKDFDEIDEFAASKNTEKAKEKTKKHSSDDDL